MKLASGKIDGYLQQPKQTRAPMLHWMPLGMETESSGMSIQQAWFSLCFIPATRLTNALSVYCWHPCLLLPAQPSRFKTERTSCSSTRRAGYCRNTQLQEQATSCQWIQVSTCWCNAMHDTVDTKQSFETVHLLLYNIADLQAKSSSRNISINRQCIYTVRMYVVNCQKPSKPTVTMRKPNRCRPAVVIYLAVNCLSS